jgi:RHS repeat-associated protein
MGCESCFTGKERDAESGNDYFEARYYSSSMGRFISPDWSARVMPIPYAKLDNPQSLNLYAYVGNNPLTRFDPDGHIDCSGKNAAGIGCQTIAAWDAAHGIGSKVLNQVGSYFYATGFKGTGDEIKVGIKGVVNLEVGHKEGTEVTRHLNGEKEEKEIKSSMHAKVEIAGYSLGAERKVEGEDSTPKWEFSAGREGVEASGGRVGINAEFCHGTCGSIEGGVEAGKALNDIYGAVRNIPPPQPGSLDELMIIDPK